MHATFVARTGVASLLLLLCWAGAGAACGQGPATGWSRGPDLGPEPALPTRIAFGAEGWLRVEEGRLLVGEGESEAEAGVEEVPGRPLGRVHGWSRDPEGTLWLACEQGVGLARPGFVADLLDLEEAAPEPPFFDVLVGADRRIWLRDAEGLLVVQPVTKHARRVRLPAGFEGPPIALRRHPQGGLAVWDSSGTPWRWDPAAHGRPPPPEVSLDAQPASPKAGPQKLQKRSVELSAQTAPGTRLRYVIDGHHMWKPLPPEGLQLSELRPGLRRVHVVAEDDTLARSAPSIVELEVPFPKAVQPKMVALWLGGGCLALLALFLFLAKRRGGGGQRYAMALISAGITVWLGLSIAAASIPHAKGWPFVGYGMYTDLAHEHDVSTKVEIRVLLAEGREESARMHRFAVRLDHSWQIVRPLLNGDAAQRQQILAGYDHGKGRETFGLAVVRHRTRLTAEGPKAVPPVTLLRFDKTQGEAR